MYSESTTFEPKIPGGPLMVIMIGRISTDHQNIENIEASYEEDERYLKRLYAGEMHIKRLGERGSGWKINRATINEALEEIKTSIWDVVIMEDLGRAYRNPQFQFMIAHLCVDHDTRLICIGDGLDTGEAHWEPILGTAVMRHSMTVPDTRRRVKRTATHAFHRGGMVLKIRFGYRRLTPEEAASGAYGPVNLRMAKVAEATPIILEIRVRALRGDSYPNIAEWLNDSGIKPGEYATSGVWTGKLVNDLLRDPILYGLRTFRDVLHKLIFSTGVHRRNRNKNPETESIPALAHMTREEHDVMVAAMDRRAPGKGKPHSRKGTARRESYWPGQHLCCAICGDEVYWSSPTQLRCRNVGPGSTRSCWSQVVVDANQVRTKLLPLLLTKIRTNPVLLEVLVDAAWMEYDRVGTRAGRRTADLESRIGELRRKCNRITTMLIDRPDSETFLQRLDQSEAEVRELRQELEAEQNARRSNSLCLTRDEVVERLDEVVLHLARTSFAFGKLMRRTFPDFTMVPIQALDTPQIHPRVKLTLPGDSGSCDREEQIVVDAFDPPQHILHLETCRSARAANPMLSIQKTSQLTGIPWITFKRTLKYAHLMEERGTTDPFVELTERPVKASRWRKQSLAPPPSSDEPVANDER